MVKTKQMSKIKVMIMILILSLTMLSGVALVNYKHVNLVNAETRTAHIYANNTSYSSVGGYMFITSASSVNSVHANYKNRFSTYTSAGSGLTAYFSGSYYVAGIRLSKTDSFSKWVYSSGKSTSASSASDISSVFTTVSTQTDDVDYNYYYIYWSALSTGAEELSVYPIITTASSYVIKYYNGYTELGSSTHTVGSSSNLKSWAALGGEVQNSSCGWKFAGWSISDSTNIKYETAASVSVYCTTKLYAVYKRTINMFLTPFVSTPKETAEQLWNPCGTTNGTNLTSVKITTSPDLAADGWSGFKGFRQDTNAEPATLSSTCYPVPNLSNNLYSIYSREIAINWYSGFNKSTQNTTYATQYVNGYNTSAVSRVTFDYVEPTSLEDKGWVALGYRTDEYPTTTAEITSSTTLSYTPSYSETFEKNFYALYAKAVNVNYYANNGTDECSTSKIIINRNASYNYIPTTKQVTFATNSFEREGYSFSKWALNSVSGTQYNEGDSYLYDINYDSTEDFNVNVYAIWNTVPYSISYNLNGGSVATANATSYNVETATFTLNNPTKTGYTFAGWTGSNGTIPQQTVSIAKGSTGNKEYTANWEAIPYSISYKLNGGSVTGNPSTYTIESATFTLVNPTKEGYNFAGWTGSNGSAAQTTVSIAKGSTGNKEYTANWSIVNYSISYNLDGGSVATANATSYNIETATFTLTNPTKTGYKFYGWTGSNGATPQTTVTIEQGSTGDKAYTANWDLNNYTVVFNANGGKNLSTVSVKVGYNQAVGTLPTCEKTGHTLIGWFTAAEGGTQVSVETLVTENITYYAHWEINTYTVTFNGNGGEVSQTEITKEYNQTIGSFPTATKTGYALSEWYIKDGEVNVPVTEATVVTEDITCYAKWDLVEYSISYSLNGGSVTTENATTYTVETGTFTLNNPTKLGYNFLGWTGSNGETPEMEAIIEKGSTGDKEFSANWETVKYAITYKLNDGSVATENLSEYTVETDTFTLNNPTKLGYNFLGWTGSNGETPEMEVIIEKGSTGDKEFSANWEMIKYTITYNLDGGSVATENAADYNIETESFTLNNPTKEGFNFIGWTGTDLAEPTMEVVIAKGSTGNKEYTANWDYVECTVTVEVNNSEYGSVDKLSVTVHYGDLVVINENILTIGAEVITATPSLNTPEHSYNFVKFNGVENNTKITQNTVITAEFERTINTFIVTFNANGGEVSQSTITKEYNQAIGLLPTVTRVGYNFAGWFTAVEGGTQITEQTLVTENVEYFAQWSVITYTITYNLEEGSVATQNPTEYTVETANFTLTNPTKEGYTFSGWTGSNGTTAQVNVTIEQGSTGDKNYTANWAINSYKVTFNANGGECSETEITKEYNQAIGLLPTATRTGYTFTGWFTEQTNGTQITEQTLVTADVTYYAHWTAADVSYTVNHYLENVGNSLELSTLNCELKDSETLSAKADSTISVSTKQYAGFTAPIAQTSLINADGSTVVNYFYSRNSHIINVNKDANITSVTISGISYNDTAKTADYGDSLIMNIVAANGYQVNTVSAYKNGDPNTKLTIENNSFVMGAFNVIVQVTSKVEEYTISYQLNGGVVDTENPTKYSSSTETFTLNNPAKEGYNFVGWLGTGLTEETTEVIIEKGSTGNRTYRAIFQAIEYTISYTLNNGVVTGNPVSYTIETDTFTLVNPTKTGYEFKGWTGTNLAQASLEVSIQEGSKGNRTYTANWEVIKYTITYQLNNGSVATQNPTEYTIETDTFTLVNPTKSGYSFMGWTGTGLTETTAEVTITKGSTGNRIYTANYKGVITLILSSTTKEEPVVTVEVTSTNFTQEEILLNGQSVALSDVPAGTVQFSYMVTINDNSEFINFSTTLEESFEPSTVTLKLYKQDGKYMYKVTAFGTEVDAGELYEDSGSSMGVGTIIIIVIIVVIIAGAVTTFIVIKKRKSN